MGKTPEGVVKQRVKELLIAYGVHYFMPVQTGFGQTHLDFICCYNGVYIAIETKAKAGDKPTAKQSVTMETIIRAGGIAMLIDGIEAVGKLAVFLEANRTSTNVPLQSRPPSPGDPL